MTRDQQLAQRRQEQREHIRRIYAQQHQTRVREALKSWTTTKK